MDDKLNLRVGQVPYANGHFIFLTYKFWVTGRRLHSDVNKGGAVIQFRYIYICQVFHWFIEGDKADKLERDELNT